jgi:RimJ/RimL family protein N-acetyltransferase
VSVTAIDLGADVSTVTAALFTCSLGDDAALIPRTVAITEAYQALLEVNYERLARWFPGFGTPPALEGTRAALRRRGQAWLEGSQLPLAIAVKAEDGWRLVGEVNLLIDGPARSGEVGYWLDADFEGRGLVTRAVTQVLDQAFGPLGLRRVELRTNPTNKRSRSVAERLGFTQEGVLREAAAFPDERRDEVVYGLLASEWHKAAN